MTELRSPTDLSGALEGWGPGPSVSTGSTTAWAVSAFRGLLDLPADARDGEVLPPLWHWFGFLDQPRQDELGEDGHPAHGHFMPDLPDRRRMIAGGRTEFRQPMRVGETLERRSSLLRSDPKRGRSGEMLLVTVRHEYLRGFNGGEIVAVEEQDIVYRSQPPGQTRQTPPYTGDNTAPPPSPPAVKFTADEAVLFRFSALTYNSHRIHYDLRYATEVEGYPGLVVHGPLLALLALELPRRWHPDSMVTGFDYRLHRPVFAPQEVIADQVDVGRAGTLDVAVGVPGAPHAVTATITVDHSKRKS